MECLWIECLLHYRSSMQVMVSKHDLLHSWQDGFNHSVARALHFRIGSTWKVSDDERSATEIVAPFRVVPLPESVPLTMKRFRAVWEIWRDEINRMLRSD